MSRCGQLASTFQARVSGCKGVRGPGAACSCWTQPDLADMHTEIRSCSYKVTSIDRFFFFIFSMFRSMHRG